MGVHIDGVRIRRAQALQMRVKGSSLDEIRVACGYKTNRAVRQAITRAVKKATTEATDTLRHLENIRLDHMLSQAMEVAEEWDDPDLKLKAVEVGLKIQTRRAALIGLDATGAEVDGSAVDQWLEDMAGEDLTDEDEEMDVYISDELDEEEDEL